MAAAAAVGWLLNYLFVADQSRAGLLALPVWLLAGAGAGWLAIRWRERSRDQRIAESRLDGIEAALDRRGSPRRRCRRRRGLESRCRGAVRLRSRGDRRPPARGPARGGRAGPPRRSYPRRGAAAARSQRTPRPSSKDVFTAAVTTILIDLPEALVVAQDVGEVWTADPRSSQRRGGRPPSGASAARHLRPWSFEGRETRSSARRSTARRLHRRRVAR